MSYGFTFERALSWPFVAPHFSTFPWLFGAAYAACHLAVFGLLALIGARDLTEWVTALEALPDTVSPDAAASLMLNPILQLLPLVLISGLAAWALWAMFETASQRRYIWGERFSLGFGADEARMMVVGLLWGLLGVAVFIIPVIIVFGGVFAMLSEVAAGTDPDEIEGRIVATVFGAFGLILLVYPLYVFLATRLAPCFGLTVKDKRIRFLEAWGVSRGRFWPILGAYVILAVGGAFVIQLAQGIGQLVLLPVFMFGVSGPEPTAADMAAYFMSAGFLIPVAIFMFFFLFLQGILQHAVGAPAALAARFDPKGSVEDIDRVAAFT